MPLLRRVLPTLVLLCWAASLSAQRQTGNLLGEITDNQGAAISGVTVTITPGPRVQVTNARGQFRVLALAPGIYTVVAEVKGFNKDKTEIAIDPGQNTTLAITLVPSEAKPPKS